MQASGQVPSRLNPISIQYRSKNRRTTNGLATIVIRPLVGCLAIPCTAVAGEKAGKSLLGRDEPTVWYEALEAAAPSQGNSQPAQLDDSAVESLRNEADAATANEALVFEQNLSEPLRPTT